MTNKESEDLEYLVQEYIEKKKIPQNFMEKVTEILYYHDTMGFSPHFPEDEYDIEAANIIAGLRHVSNLKELQWMIYDVFVCCFSALSAEPIYDKRYTYIAEEIWDAWQEEIERLNLEKSTRIFGK